MVVAMKIAREAPGLGHFSPGLTLCGDAFRAMLFAWLSSKTCMDTRGSIGIMQEHLETTLGLLAFKF